MKKFLPVILSVILLLPFSGCMEKEEEGVVIARNFWVEVYEPEVNISDIMSGGLPDVNICYAKVGEGKENAGIGDQIFLYYSIYLANMNGFNGKAYCIVDGKKLSSLDIEHEYLPTFPEQSSQIGLPSVASDETKFSPENIYAFRWPYRFSHYGKHTVKFYVKGEEGITYGGIERNFSLEYIEQDDNRWALILNVDPPGDEIASWKDGAMVFDLLYHHYGFPRSNVMCLSNGCATRENLIDVMKWLSEHTNSDSKIVFWASGHGGIELYGDNDKEPIDGKIELWDGNLYDGDVADFFASSKSMHILSVIDTCFSGEFGGPDDMERIFTHFGSENSIEEEGRVLITASTTFARAKATEDGGILTILMAGALEGIKDRLGTTADINGDGKISAEEAGFWAAFHCYAHPLHGRPQLNDCYMGDMYLEK
ncbi:MAG: hypothetical protein U9O96_02745 [Candidatus Thermoplasmatota archaeon]|nr:hypothetical protein [Candidatus Thermoplasmatota archaeon]